MTLSLDHLRYVEDQAYRRELHIRLRRLVANSAGVLSPVSVIHEADQSCCRIEPWPVTYASLLVSLEADGEQVLGVAL